MKPIGFLLVVLLAILTTTLVSARPTKSDSLSRQKRQSDQRIAELETLLALQKYGRHKFRMDRKKGVGAHGEHPPGYGIIDFRVLGRKKKSIRFSPGESEIPLNEEILQNRPKIYRLQQENLEPLQQQQQPQRPDSFEGSSEELESIYPDEESLSEKNSRTIPKEDPFLYIEEK